MQSNNNSCGRFNWSSSTNTCKYNYLSTQKCIIADDIEINQQKAPQLITIKIDPEDSNVTIINDQKQPTPIQSEDGDHQFVDNTSEDDQDQLHVELKDNQDA